MNERLFSAEDACECGSRIRIVPCNTDGIFLVIEEDKHNLLEVVLSSEDRVRLTEWLIEYADQLDPDE